MESEGPGFVAQAIAELEIVIRHTALPKRHAIG